MPRVRIASGVALFILCLGLLLTAAGVWWQSGVAEQIDRSRLEQTVERHSNEVLRRLNQVVASLKATRAALESNASFGHSQFTAYVNELDWAVEYPGFQGMGYVERSRADAYLVRYAEPLGALNELIGQDLGSKASARAALRSAVETGQVSFLSHLHAPDVLSADASFLVFAPVYRQDVSLQSAATRDQALRGFVFVAVSGEGLLAGMDAPAEPATRFALYDSPKVDAATQLFDSSSLPSQRGTAMPSPARAVYATDRQYILAGHIMTLHTSGYLAEGVLPTGQWWAGVAGAIVSVLLAISAWLLVAGRQRAQALAQSMTAELDRLAQVVQHTANAVTIMDRDLKIQWVNQGFSQITGYSLEEAQGRTPGDLLDSGKSSPNAMAVLHDSLLRGASCRVELINRARDGHEYWADTELQPTFDKQGNLTGYMEIGTDISRQKLTQQQLEKAIRDASALLHTVQTHAIVSMTDAHGAIIDVNDAFCQVSGYTHVELRGKDHRILSSGKHSASFWQELWATVARGQPWRGEICNRAKDGSLFWLDSMIAPFVGSDGEIEKYVAMQTEITARHNALERLRQSEATFYASFHNAASGMAFLTPQAQWKTANPAICEFLGYSESELHELTFYDTSHPDEWRVDQEQIRRLLDGELAVYQRAKRFVHRDGFDLWGLVSIAVVWRSEGVPEFIVVQIVDITTRKRVEDALSLSNALMEESQRVARVGGWQIEVGGDDIYWTAEAYRIHETSPEEFHPTVHSGLADYVDDSRERLERALHKVCETGESFDLEVQKRTAKGRVIDLRVTGAATWTHGKVTRVSGIYQDITERKQYESTLQEARLRAEQATLSKGQFLANMSHEIRTPMNAILGMLKLLHNTDLSERQRDYASKTEGAARSLLGLINDILDFSKVEAGKMQLDPQPFRLDRLLRDLAVILSSNVGAKPVEVLFDVDPAVPKLLVGDALRLQQVLINLGGNAVKFTAQGQVVLGLRLQQLSSQQARVEFSVQDSGIGIAPEHQSHIFTGFSQAEAATTRKFGGTGLGLAISKRLVELMGSELVLRSALGEGSTFSFTLDLPCVASDSPARAELDIHDDEPLLHSAMRRVLIVEKNPVARELLARVVQSWGWPTEVVGDGEAALELVRIRMARGQFPFDVIYVDWHLPGLDGWVLSAAMRQLCTQQNGQQPVIVMVSSNTRETLDQRTQEEQACVNSFLVKPVTASMLLEATVAADTSGYRLRSARRSPVRRRRLHGMRILVVEDNLINQQVAEELLMAEGALVSLAANGQAGIDAIAAGACGQQFDAVLMDIQMPILDGYAATRIVRERMGLLDLPIIAMTANAMASDRDECIAVGMNEHVGKPFELAELVSTLLRVTGFHVDGDARAAPSLPAQSADAHVAAPAPAPAQAPIDVASALARMGGLQRLYIRSADAFVQSLPPQVQELKEAALKDHARASLIAHTLKGTAAMLGAGTLSAQAAVLEKCCKQEVPQAQIDAGMAELEQAAGAALDHMRVVIAQLRDDGTLYRVADAVAAEPQTPAAAPVADAAQSYAQSGGAPANTGIQQATAELLACLQADEMESLAKFAQIRDVLSGLPAALFEPLEHALQDLDFSVALQICIRIQDWMGASRQL